MSAKATAKKQPPPVTTEPNGTQSIEQARAAIQAAELEISSKCYEEMQSVLKKYNRQVFARAELYVDRSGYVRAEAVPFIGPAEESPDG